MVPSTSLIKVGKVRMLKILWQFARIVLLFLSLISVSLVLTIFLYVFFILEILSPLPSWRSFFSRAVNGAYRAWVLIFLGTHNYLYHPKIKIQMRGEIDPKKSYLILANHQSWMDIFLVFTLFKKQIAYLRFFLKRALIFIPLIGFCVWMLGFPFLRRNDKKSIRQKDDLKTIRRFCKKFRNKPVSVVNFAEGTRFTSKKKEKQNSPYRHLLIPKVGGMANVFRGLKDQLHEVIDVTIIYEGGPCRFWDFLLGKMRPVTLDVRVRPVTPDLIGNYSIDREYRKHVQLWANQVWAEKDEVLEKYLKHPS
jgi:1-acyl-sn-glycerol-3-phosphate acyltransferase